MITIIIIIIVDDGRFCCHGNKPCGYKNAAAMIGNMIM
jgi:hypothetical protein